MEPNEEQEWSPKEETQASIIAGILTSQEIGSREELLQRFDRRVNYRPLLNIGKKRNSLLLKLLKADPGTWERLTGLPDRITPTESRPPVPVVWHDQDATER